MRRQSHCQSSGQISIYQISIIVYIVYNDKVEPCIGLHFILFSQPGRFNAAGRKSQTPMQGNNSRKVAEDLQNNTLFFNFAIWKRSQAFSQKLIKGKAETIMGKAETVKKYADEFLKGKSEEAKAKFHEKDVSKQYASIMQWRSKMRRNSSATKTTTITNVLALLRQAKALLPRINSMDEQKTKLLFAEIDSLRQAVSVYEEGLRQRRIRELEARKEEISRELQKLRGSEPSLFDGLED